MHSYPDDFRNTVGVTIPNGNRVFIQIDYSECTRLPFDDATLRQKLQRIFDNADERGEGKRSVMKYAASQPNNLMRMYIMSPFDDRTHLHIDGMLFAQGAPAQYFDGLKIPLDVRRDNNYSSNISLKAQTGNVFQYNNMCIFSVTADKTRHTHTEKRKPATYGLKKILEDENVKEEGEGKGEIIRYVLICVLMGNCYAVLRIGADGIDVWYLRALSLDVRKPRTCTRAGF
ncbi:hypothetical protein SCHPADRAFT_894058 [Schizopora paradoxa]|uniref:Uncharacterized protein n=1 Tax=Schizopora paradoxa TaxID=27342 RepID=A0A0H2R9Y9_9AGAM|nr:hypothetical protein SCHPADRAFT_894058 [Schizopora paradoxa]